MKFLRNNGLSIVLLALFLGTLLGHALAGHAHENEERREQGRQALSLVQYASGGEFIETVFENWESEFLQMAMYLVLTALLFQKGSAESNDPDEGTKERERPSRDSPGRCAAADPG